MGTGGLIGSLLRLLGQTLDGLSTLLFGNANTEVNLGPLESRLARVDILASRTAFAKESHLRLSGQLDTGVRRYLYIRLCYRLQALQQPMHRQRSRLCLQHPGSSAKKEDNVRGNQGFVSSIRTGQDYL